MHDITEDVREYWNTRPCNIRHSPRPIGTREYFDEVEQRKYFVEPHIPQFADFQRWSGKRVLEIGCGIGTDTMNFARAGALVTAVDYSEKSIAIAQQRAKFFGLEGKINFYHGDAQKLSSFVPVQEYDLIYSFGVIHHIPDPGKVLEQVKAYMGAGSELRLMVYHKWCWKTWQILCSEGFRFWKLDKFIAKHSEAQSGSPVTYAYSRASVRRLLAGFTIDDMFIDHIFPYRVTDYREYRYVKMWYIRYLPPALFRRFERIFGWHLCVKARLASEQ